MKKVVLFCRVSSTNDRQSYDRQIIDLTQLAATHNFQVEAVFAEKVSGAKKNNESKELMNLIEYVNTKLIRFWLLSFLAKAVIHFKF